MNMYIYKSKIKILIELTTLTENGKSECNSQQGTKDSLGNSEIQLNSLSDSVHWSVCQSNSLTLTVTVSAPSLRWNSVSPLSVTYHFSVYQSYYQYHHQYEYVKLNVTITSDHQYHQSPMSKSSHKCEMCY